MWSSSVESSQHIRYVIFINDCTRYTCLYPLKGNYDFYEVFVKFQKVAEKLFTETIKIFQCDGGGELNSSDFLKHLANVEL